MHPHPACRTLHPLTLVLGEPGAGAAGGRGGPHQGEPPLCPRGGGQSGHQPVAGPPRRPAAREKPAAGRSFGRTAGPAESVRTAGRREGGGGGGGTTIGGRGRPGGRV
jgi:hypothetical protein